jgi:hypothetical protein
MKAIAIITVLLAGVISAAQSKTDEGIRKILDDEITAWNQGDTDGYSKHFVDDGTFTNVMGIFLPDDRLSVTGTKSFSKGRSAGLCYSFRSCRYGSSHLTLPSARP